jgi:hypothetical protein
MSTNENFVQHSALAMIYQESMLRLDMVNINQTSVNSTNSVTISSEGGSRTTRLTLRRALSTDPAAYRLPVGFERSSCQNKQLQKQQKQQKQLPKHVRSANVGVKEDE